MLTTVIDGLLEATVIPSFSAIGPQVRRRLFDWSEPRADLTGAVVVVTGSSSGIGTAIATQLTAMGATTWVTSRSQARADDAAADVLASAGAGATVGHGVDMGELDQVRAFAQRLRDQAGQVDVLIHNAGALTEERHTTSAGIEATVAAHLVGPYVLTREVTDLLTPGARVLFMSSGGMYTQGLTLRGLEMSPEAYKGATAYARAKRAQVVLAGLLGEELAGRAIVHAMHPGWAATPGVTASLPAFDRLMKPILRTPDQAADTMVWLATAEEPATSTGDFWHDRRRRSTTRVPGTTTDPRRRDELIGWLDERIAVADAQAA